MKSWNVGSLGWKKICQIPFVASQYGFEFGYTTWKEYSSKGISIALGLFLPQVTVYNFLYFSWFVFHRKDIWECNCVCIHDKSSGKATLHWLLKHTMSEPIMSRQF